MRELLFHLKGKKLPFYSGVNTLKTAFLIFTILITGTVFCQTDLKTGDTLTRHISKGHKDQYRVKVSREDFYKLEVMQNGIDLQINVKFPDGKNIILDSPNGMKGPEPIEFPAASNGYVILEVSPLDDSQNTEAGDYTIKYLKKIGAVEYAQMLKKDEAEREEFTGWIRQNAVPLTGVMAGSGFEDLEFLKTVLMNKRVVALGEATHGTKEFFEMKHRMLEFLVTEMGFTVFGIEASYGRCKYINEYVLNGKGDLDTAAVIHGFVTWSTEEVKDMIQWMRNYNESHPDKKIQFVGFDLQINDAAEFAIHNYYMKVDPSKTESVDILLKKVAEAESSGGIFSGDTAIRALIVPMQNLINDFTGNQKEYISKSSLEEYDEILWDHEILEQYLISYSRNNFAEAVKQDDRDFFMAQNILAWLKHFPKGTKMMIWAHNGHIAKDFVDAVSVPSMGSYLKSALKDEYYSLGFDFYVGKFRSNDIDLKDSPGWEEEEVGRAPDNNLSSFFVKAGLGNSILDFSQTPQDDNVKRWLNEKIICTYSMGSQFSEKWPVQSYTAPMKLQQAFDGVIFIKESNSASPVKRMDIRIYEF